LPRAVWHVTISHAAYARHTPRVLLVLARRAMGLCRIAYGASGHRATLRSKILEADIWPSSGINARVGPVASKRRSSRASGYPAVVAPAERQAPADGLGHVVSRAMGGGRAPAVAACEPAPAHGVIPAS